MRVQNNLLEDVKKCLVDSVYDITQNFSLEKSRTYYNLWKEKWDRWDYRLNPVAVLERFDFNYSNLAELSLKSMEAQNLYSNIDKDDLFKWVRYCVITWMIRVEWYRLKTFDEWLEQWLKDALMMHYKNPEDWARKVLQKRLWKWLYDNSSIHMYVEWEITEEQLHRLATYELPRKITWWDIDDDIYQAKKALYDMEENNKDLIWVEDPLWYDWVCYYLDEKTKKRYSTRSYIEIDEDELCKYWKIYKVEQIKDWDEIFDYHYKIISEREDK